MTHYSVQPRGCDRLMIVKSNGFLLFAKNMGKNIGKSLSKNLSGKYSKKLLDHDKQSATDAFKIALKRAFKKQQKQQVI